MSMATPALTQAREPTFPSLSPVIYELDNDGRQFMQSLSETGRFRVPGWPDAPHLHTKIGGMRCLPSYSVVTVHSVAVTGMRCASSTAP